MTNQEKLYNSFANALQIDLNIINDGLKYQSIPEWDSISHMVLINEIETNLDIIIDTDDVIDMSSVQKAKEILKKQNILF